MTFLAALKHILVPSDCSECSGAAGGYGLELARKFDATLHLLVGETERGESPTAGRNSPARD